MKAKKLFIIAGANGVGKTTLAGELLKEYSLEFLNADEIAKGLNPADLKKVRVSAGKIFFKKLEDLITKNASFAIESTLAGTYLIKYMNRLRENNYKIDIIYFFLDNPEICINRINTRVKMGGHPVSKEDIIRRFYRSKINFWNKYRFISDKWSVLYNGFEKGILVATGQGNYLEIVNEELFEIFMEDISGG